MNKIDFKRAKLKGRIIEKYGSQQEFARQVGKSEQTVIAKMKGRSAFKQQDIIEWCTALDINTEDIGTYFFAH